MPPIVLVLNGPNLNLLGTREPATYGHETLADVAALCGRSAEQLGLKIEFRQTNTKANYSTGSTAPAPVAPVL